MRRACLTEGCDTPYTSRGWCGKHYRYWQRKGVVPAPTPNTRGLPLEQRVLTFFTKGEGCWTWRSTGGQGYGLINVAGKIRPAHVVMFELEVGPVPAGMCLDHICRVRSCVRPDHLRIVTTKQNLENLSGANRSNKSSGVRGVHWHKASGKWSGQVGHNLKRIHVGLFATIEEAEAAVIARRNELFTHNEADRIAS